MLLFARADSPRVYIMIKVKSFSCVRLFATPQTVAHQAPPSMGFSRQEYWNGGAIAFSMKRSLVFPILLFSSICLHWSLRKAFLSLLAILWNSAFRWRYLSFSPLLFISLLFTALHKASSDSQFVFLYFSFLGMVLIPVSCTMSQTSVYSSSGTQI